MRRADNQGATHGWDNIRRHASPGHPEDPGRSLRKSPRKRRLILSAAGNEGKLHALQCGPETEHGIPVHPFAADLPAADAALDVRGFALEQDTGTDVLISSAAFGDPGSFADGEWQRQYGMVQLNVIALMQMPRGFLNPMGELGRGKTLNMSSPDAFCAGPYMSSCFATREFCAELPGGSQGNRRDGDGALPGPAPTGFEQAASMKKGSAMFPGAAGAEDAAEGGIRAALKGKAPSCCGGWTTQRNVPCRTVPGSAAGKHAAGMNR